MTTDNNLFIHISNHIAHNKHNIGDGAGSWEVRQINRVIVGLASPEVECGELLPG